MLQRANHASVSAWLIVYSIFLKHCYTATVRDVFVSNENLLRVPRQDKLYLDRYGANSPSESTLNTRTIKPEEASDSRETNLGKRCIRCDGRYPNYDPYDSRRYDDRGSYRDRYEDPRDRYYDRRYDPYERYDKYDRYDQRRDYYDRDRDRYYDRDRDRNYERGMGYDNRGYDYRDYRDRDYYRPAHYDDRYDEFSGRGYVGRPYDYAGYGGGGYASAWNYGGGRDDYRDRYLEDRYRYRDPYDGYRPTSYLYGRPSNVPISNTTSSPDKTSNATQPPENSNSG